MHQVTRGLLCRRRLLRVAVVICQGTDPVLEHLMQELFALRDRIRSYLCYLVLNSLATFFDQTGLRELSDLLLWLYCRICRPIYVDPLCLCHEL